MTTTKMTMSKGLRKSWDRYFMDIAWKVSERATCTRLHVGAVLVENKRIVSTGYNGAPSGAPQCDTVGCAMKDGRCIRSVHAEPNLFMHAPPREGTDLYITHVPCWHCALLVANSNVERVYYGETYRKETDLTVIDYLYDRFMTVAHLP